MSRVTAHIVDVTSMLIDKRDYTWSAFAEVGI